MANLLAPPPSLTISQWADKYRKLSPESSAEPGQWRTDRTPYMREIMDCIGDRFVERVVIKSSAQIGKALAIDTPIPTPYGFTIMADIQAGDYVFDEQGKPALVTFATDVMKDRECYEVIFSDGARVVCDAEHLWKVQKRNGSGALKDVVETAQQIHEQLLRDKKGRHRYSIKLNAPLHISEKNLPISPYTLGAWLGDGNSVNNTLVFHEDDSEIATHIADDGYAVHTCHRDKRNCGPHTSSALIFFADSWIQTAQLMTTADVSLPVQAKG
jgi:hypothetical protein